ncbi:MAG: hypothetical protein ACXW0H_04210 [Methylobacter sp.]
MNIRRTLLIIFGAIAAWNCQAIAYILEPRFAADQRYDSNIFLREKPLQGNWISTISPGLDLGFRRENSELKSNFTWNQLIYNNQSELNIDEQLLSINYRHTGERFKWKLNTSYNNQSSLNTEQDLSGFLAVQVMRKSLNIGPSVSYALDERNLLMFNYSYYKVNYEKLPRLILNDYDYHQASATFSHLYTERDQVNITLSSSRYKTPTAQLTSLNHIAQLGWQHSFSEQILTFISAGILYTQTESTVQIPGHFIFNPPDLQFVPASEITTKSNSFGEVFQATFKKDFERGSFSINASQSQLPTALGNQLQTQLRVNNSYALSERWNTGIDASYSIYETPSSVSQNGSINRTYYSIRPNIIWKWTEEMSFEFSYTYRQQKLDNVNQAGEGNIAQLKFIYQPLINDQVK